MSFKCFPLATTRRPEDYSNTKRYSALQWQTSGHVSSDHWDTAEDPIIPMTSHWPLRLIDLVSFPLIEKKQLTQNFSFTQQTHTPAQHCPSDFRAPRFVAKPSTTKAKWSQHPRKHLEKLDLAVSDEKILQKNLFYWPFEYTLIQHESSHPISWGLHGVLLKSSLIWRWISKARLPI